MMARCTVLLCVLPLLVGCGRLGYDSLAGQDADAQVGDADAQSGTDAQAGTDAASSTDLRVTDRRPTAFEVSVPGRFKLVFDAAYTWQASEWYDLETRPEVNLVRRDQELHHSVAQAPLLITYRDDLLTLDLAQSPDIEVITITTRQVVFKTEWIWIGNDQSQIEGEAVHTIDADGTWQVEGELKSLGAPSLVIDAVSYADAHLAPAHSWQLDGEEDGPSYTLTATANQPPSPQLHVSRQAGAPGVLGTYKGGNASWTVTNQTITADGWEVIWTNRIWPPMR